MKTRIASLVLIWTGIFAAFVQAGAPSIVFATSAGDLGRLTQGETGRHAFVFGNKGNAALEILSVETTCGCTIAGLSAKKIPAGKEGRIEVQVNTAGMSGSLEKHVYVKTNDPRHREVVLTVKAVVEPEIEMSDYGLFFGNAPKGKEVRREILFTVPAGKSIKLLGAVSTDRRIAVKLDPAPGIESRKWKLIAIRKADAGLGDHYGEIRVKTSSRFTPTITLHVHGTVTGPS